MSETTERTGIPYVKRIIIILLVVLGAYLAYGPLTVFHPIKPPVFLLPELLGKIGPIEIRNSMIGVLLADLVLLWIGFLVWSFNRSGKQVPSGFYNMWEALLEYWWNLVQSIAGHKAAGKLFPLVATIFLLVFSANVTKLLPGFEAIGWFEQVHSPEVQGYAPYTIIPGFLYSLDAGEKQNYEDIPGHSEEEGVTSAGGGLMSVVPAEGGEEEHGPCEFACEVIPFLRAPATDLNFTVAIALSTMLFIQVLGIQANGLSYFSKFFQLDGFAKLFAPKFDFLGVFIGMINFIVGILELISEFIKVISFSFRLFGAIFAGTLLFAVLGTIAAVVVPAGVFGLELFVGAIQAVVFALLATVFASQALASHHGDEGHEHH